MAGTLTISTLSDGTNSTSSTNCIQGSAKAWVNFNGSTAAIRASYNVSSITKITAGQYTVNFTTAFADSSYSAVMSCSMVNSGNNNASFNFGNGTSPASTTALYVYTGTNGWGGYADATMVCVAVNR